MSNELEIFKVNQSELPNIITDQWRDIQGLEDKVKKSVKMAQTAKTSADRAYGKSAGFRSFYHGLVKHGVRIYEWTPGFCHAKISVADDCMATCGTINLDYRSLYHHFENGCFMADCQAVLDIRNDLAATMDECREVTEQYSTGRSAYLRLGQLFMRLFAGLL